MAVERAVALEAAISVAQCDDGESWYGFRRDVDGVIIQTALACSREKAQGLLDGTRTAKKASRRFRRQKEGGSYP